MLTSSPFSSMTCDLTFLNTQFTWRCAARTATQKQTHWYRKVNIVILHSAHSTTQQQPLSYGHSLPVLPSNSPKNSLKPQNNSLAHDVEYRSLHPPPPHSCSHFLPSPFCDPGIPSVERSIYPLHLDYCSISLLCTELKLLS